jgi:hypothetical protein
MDIERALRDSFTSHLERASSPVLAERTRRRIRRRRVFTTLTASALTLALAFSAAVYIPSLFQAAGKVASRNSSSHGSHSSGSHLSGATPTPTGYPSGWVAHTSGGISIATPAEWTFRAGNPTNLVSPTISFAVGTWDFPSGGECAPTKALQSLPSEGMFMYVVELSEPDIPPRPDTLQLGRVQGHECAGDIQRVEFEDGGRDIQVNAAFGPHASSTLRDQADEAINSLAVQPQSSGAAAQQSRPKECSSVPYRPALLPWVPKGKPIPAPGRVHHWPNFLLNWRAPQGSGWRSVRIESSYRVNGRIPGGPNASVPGATADLYYFYETHRPGYSAAFWKDGAGPCNSYVLTVVPNRQIGKHRAIRWARRVAESLVRR